MSPQEEQRGGIEAARYCEWGGKNLDGTDGFKDNRYGWAMPIHQLLVENNVSIVFHGHDHFFAKQEMDGVVYQLIPQPGHHGQGAVRSAEEYGVRQRHFGRGFGLPSSKSWHIRSQC